MQGCDGMLTPLCSDTGRDNPGQSNKALFKQFLHKMKVFLWMLFLVIFPD